MFEHLAQRAATYDGYLGIEAARNSDGTGVAAVCWKDLASIEAWARDPEHQVAKRKGREISAKSSALMADPTARRIGSVESILSGGHL
jgi:heme-degrading monooxygenase HmoA